jgi:hypothetical protein
MENTVKARFDGQVFVPERPVDLPTGTVVDVPLPVPSADPGVASLGELVSLLEKFPSNPDWAPDSAAQHDHYLYGKRKQP